MKKMKILLFGGTTEGREIAASGLPVFYSVTTGYGAGLADFPNVESFVGRMDVKAMTDFITSRPVAGVIDATHPYAVEATHNIRAACADLNVPYARVSRVSWGASEIKDAVSVSSCEEAADFLRNFLPQTEGNALLTIGGKELGKFSALSNPLKQRLYARVLPSSQIIESCEKLGFDAGHIVAMKGPFTKAMNKATLEMTNSRVLVTKDGGAAGGLKEKLEAAEELGVTVLLVRRPEETVVTVPGMTVAEAVEWGFRMLGLPNSKNFSYFPFFTNIAGRRTVVVGGGKVAARRVKTLLACGALVTVVSPSFNSAFNEPEFVSVERLPRPYRKGDLEGSAVLTVTATDDRSLNHQVGIDAKSLGIPVSVADAPDECTFLFPALVERNGVAAALSTGGRSPALCHRLADRLRSVWPDWIEEMRGEI